MSTISLPSGMVGEIRGLAGRDGRYLTDERKIRDNEVEDFMLSHCWTRTLDPGPYALPGNGEPDWNNILVGDRFYALIATQVATYPDKPYTLPLRCVQRACKKPYQWDIDLHRLLDERTKTLAPEDREVFKAGNRFQGVVPYTKPPVPFVYKLKTGGDAKRLQKWIEAKKVGPKKMVERQNQLVDSLGGSLWSIGDKTRREDIFDALEDLSLGSIDAMLPLIQEHDCGVDTNIDVQCPHCGEEMSISLPFGRAFFMPASSAAKFLPEKEAATTEETKTGSDDA